MAATSTDRSRITLTIVRFAGVATLVLVLGYITLLWQVIQQASSRGPIDSATLGAIGALGPLVGGAVTGMFALLTRVDSLPKESILTEVTNTGPDEAIPVEPAGGQ